MFSRDPLAHPGPLIERVYAFVAYRLGSGPDAEDVTSDVFERALRYRGSYDRRKGDPLAWLLGIARRCIAESALSSRRETPSEAVELEAVDNSQERIELRLELAGALARLGDRERELVALRYGADLSVRQIAELLGERTNTLEVALHRALQRLRPLLDEESRDRESVRKTPRPPVSPHELSSTRGEPA